MENEIKVKDQNKSGEFWGKVLFFYWLSLPVAVPVFLVKEWDMVHGLGTFIAYLLVVSGKSLAWPFFLLFG